VWVRAPHGRRRREPPPLGELARAAQISKQTVGSVVDQLERAGYVSRVADPTDARARLVIVTDLGRELVELSLPAVREIESAWQAHLGAAETRQLRRTLETLREITDPFAEPKAGDAAGPAAQERLRAAQPSDE
jgi:DNA-binding MarR family transcriptional regulator